MLKNYSKNLINFLGKIQILISLEKGLIGYPIVDAGMRESFNWLDVQ